MAAILTAIVGEDPVTASIGTPALWAGFVVLILAMLVLDLGVFHRQPRPMRFREAWAWSAAWVGISLLFNLGVYLRFGREKALEFLTGYLIEKALSVDNLFVFLVVFGSFAVPAAHQHRVLFWGVAGALVMRAALIAAGAAALQAFHGVVYVFAGILLVTGLKLLRHRHRVERPERNPLFRLLQRLVPATRDYHGARFTVRLDGRRVATPLLLVLVLVEITDLVFAVDSIPAIFAVTGDPFIVFTSNAFAMLGLRALYFCLAGFVASLRDLKVGLALVLVFVALKMMLADVYRLPIEVSLLVVGLLLVGSVVTSLVRERWGTPRERPGA
jgi:tellurite resistance protein TerC